MRNIYIAVLMAFVLVACDEESAQSQEQPAQSQKECSKELYIDMDGYVFKLPRDRIFGLFYGDEPIKQPCISSPNTSVISDRFSFKHEIKIPGYDKPYQAQFLFSAPSLRRDYLMEVKEQLERDGIQLEDFEMIGTFYRFPLSDKYKTAHYISTNPALKDINGDPIVISGCGPETRPNVNFVDCDIIFKWRPNILVWIRETGTYKRHVPQIDTIEIWNEIFPIYTAILESALITNDKGEQP